MATIDNLIKAVPETRDGVEGYAMTWPEGQPSPPWLAKEQLDELWTNLGPKQRESIDKAKAAGLADPS